MRKILFIHVPKTAGTAIEVFFRDTIDGFYVQANSLEQLAEGRPALGRVKDLDDIRRILASHAGLSLHVDSNFDAERRTGDFRSLAPFLFEPRHEDYFAQFTILTMVRHPFRRFLSDYAFVRRMKDADPGFLPDLDVGSVEAYLHQVHPDSMLHFLLEPQLSRPRTITRSDFERVAACIERYPIHVGVFERFEDSVAMFAEATGRRFTAADVPVLNAGHPPSHVDDRVEAAFRQRHALDYELYELAVRRLDRLRGLPSSSSAR